MQEIENLLLINWMGDYFVPASAEHQKKEKAKARELRQSQWWKTQLGKGVCYHCQQRFHPSELTMDHLIAIARGGKSDKKNCVASCKECNSKKGSKTTFEMALSEMNPKPLKSEGESSEDDTE